MPRKTTDNLNINQKAASKPNKSIKSKVIPLRTIVGLRGRGDTIPTIS